MLVKLLALGCLASIGASAQDFFWNTVSARSVAMGGVYVPSSTGASDSLSANPAGLAAIPSRTVDVSLAGVFSRGSFTNSVNSGAPLRNPVGFVPYGAFAMPLGHSRFSLGAGVVPELTSVSKWRYADAPGAAGASYGVQNQKSAILASRSAAGLGFALSKAVAVGVSLSAVYNSNTLEAPYIFQSNPTLAGLKTLLNMHTSGFGWTTGVGIIARPSSRVQLNAAWKSRATINSTGDASGDLKQQFSALGLNAPSGFHYSARVRNILPQSVMAGASFRIDGHWIFALQGTFVNWNQAFQSLPVTLTNGTNAAVNSLLGSTTLLDTVPLRWKDQYSVQGGIERRLTEAVFIRGGYAHANNPVPSSTLAPLTAAIIKDRFSTGVGYRHDRWRVDLAYSLNPLAQQHVGQSALKSGEYNNSTVRVGLQGLTMNTAFQF